ncbi:hypothetical protein V502_09197 [Pseudogymnoascus sp. VKM F-4520 (FW-2644)]|nr:hypothetical protein V502_09197 [Pseudogymnoascus sp. VKM F-4520 (FW-2644)]
MEGNYADVCNSRDNRCPNDPSVVTEDFQSVPLSPRSDPYCKITAARISFNIPLNSFEFSLDSFTFPTEIESGASNNALSSSFQPELPYAGNQCISARWGYQPQTLDPHWNLLAMNEIIAGHHESVQDTEKTFADENETINDTIRGSLGPKPNRHNSSYVCDHKSCSRKGFSNKSGLERHKREVHSSQHFTCPVPSCSRSKKGFHRRYNLFEHQRRVHSSRSSNPPRAPDINSDDLFGSEETTPSPAYEIETEGENRDIGGTHSGPNTREGLKIELRGLRAIREELNRDIKSMERVLGIMGGEY